MPLGSGDAVVMASVGAALVVIESALLVVVEALSVRLTVKFDVPTAVGAPVIMPDGERVNPAGREPERIDHV